MTKMATDEEILTEQGNHDFRRAISWCFLVWGCLILGASAGMGALMLRWGVFSILCFTVAGAGTLFSVYAAFLAFLGILFPGRCSRLRFAALFILSALPFAGPTCYLLVGFHST